MAKTSNNNKIATANKITHDKQLNEPSEKEFIRSIADILLSKKGVMQRKIIFFHLRRARLEYKVCIMVGSETAAFGFTLLPVIFHLYFNFHTLYMTIWVVYEHRDKHLELLFETAHGVHVLGCRPFTPSEGVVGTVCYVCNNRIATCDSCSLENQLLVLYRYRTLSFFFIFRCEDENTFIKILN